MGREPDEVEKASGSQTAPYLACFLRTGHETGEASLRVSHMNTAVA